MTSESQKAEVSFEKGQEAANGAEEVFNAKYISVMDFLHDNVYTPVTKVSNKAWFALGFIGMGLVGIFVLIYVVNLYGNALNYAHTNEDVIASIIADYSQAIYDDDVEVGAEFQNIRVSPLGDYFYLDVVLSQKYQGDVTINHTYIPIYCTYDKGCE
jgi:hypothetical protein